MDQYPQPPQQPPQQQPQAYPARQKMSGRTKLALWLLIAPTALLVGTFILYAIANFVFGGMSDVTTTTMQGDDLFAETTNPGADVTSALNVLLFLVGAISTLTWLPGLIVGIVLLTTKK